MATLRKTAKRAAGRPGGGRRSSSTTPPPGGSTLVDLAQQVRSWTDSVLGVAGVAADVTLGAAKMMLPKPGQRAALARTGSVLRHLRETAGMSVDEVGRRSTSRIRPSSSSWRTAKWPCRSRSS